MNAPHWPVFGFGCLAFVLICTILAVALFFVFKSGEKGSTKLGAPAGCLVGCALVFLALLAALGVTLVLSFHAKQEFVRHGPFKRFEFDLEPPRSLPPGAPAEPGAENATRHARLTIELKSDQGWADLSEDITGWLRERISSEIGVRIETRTSDTGPHTLLIFEVDLPASEIEGLRRDLREVLPTLRLPQHIEAELKDD
jgi:hypothetical protein